jgi:uncharacterized protein (TIGR03435 family)
LSTMWRSHLRISAILISLSFGAALFAQQPEFEVASVKSIPPPMDGHISTRMSTDDRLVNYSNVTLKDVIAVAWGIPKFRVDGPAWLDNERYTISAKVPSGAESAQIPAMFQSLLRDRFGLMFHRESREMGILALVVAKGGSKLQPTPSITGCHVESNQRRSSLACHVDLPRFAEQLTNYTDRPVVDKTSLDGRFEINLQWIPDSAAAQDPAGGATLFQALSEQTGLRLESQRGPIEIVIIDSANRTPTEN